jgi:hypothetical protein
VASQGIVRRILGMPNKAPHLAGGCHVDCYAPRHAVALAWHGVDYIRLWPLPVTQPWWDPTDTGPGWYVWRIDPATHGVFCQSSINGFSQVHRQIGTDVKQKVPRLLIVDGQQRLTSLYAVMKGIPMKVEKCT